MVLLASSGCSGISYDSSGTDTNREAPASSSAGVSATTSVSANAAAAVPTATPNASSASGSGLNVPHTTPVTDQVALQKIADDLAATAAADRASMRYFTLEAWGNDPNAQPGVTTDMLRTATIKTINMLSTGPNIVLPATLAQDAYIYRVDMRQLKWTAAAWTNLKDTDPYFVAKDLPTTLAQAASQTMRADWFVTSIPNSPVNAYFVFLGINSDDPAIDAVNKVNRFADMAVGAPATVRAGQAVSNTEVHNRILTWHQTSAFGSGAVGSGHLFKSYNFDSDVDTANIFSHPYRPTTNAPTAAGPYDFTFADSDNLFSLPNGLFGYYTTEGASAGQVMNQNNSGAPFPGPSFCLQCHDTKTNTIALVDVAHAAIASTPAATFGTSLRTLLLGMYDNAAVNAKLQQAGASYGAAYASMKLPASETAGLNTESTNIVANIYLVFLSASTAAAELGTTPAELVAAIKKDATLSVTLSSLTVADANGQPNGTVRRDTWEASYAAVRALVFPGLATEGAATTKKLVSRANASPLPRALHGCMSSFSP